MRRNKGSKYSGFGILVFVLSTLFLACTFFTCQPPPGLASESDEVDFLVLQKAPAIYKKPAVPVGTFRLYRERPVVPREEVVKDYLQNKQAIPLNATEAQVRSAVEDYYKDFFSRHDAWISPQVRENALQRESEIKTMDTPRAIQPVEATVFALAVEFGGTDTFQLMSGETVTTSGPLKGQIPHPGSGDNNTIWYDPDLTADAKFYEKLIFGYEGVGRVRMDLTDPYDGQQGINLIGQRSGQIIVIVGQQAGEFRRLPQICSQRNPGQQQQCHPNSGKPAFAG